MPLLLIAMASSLIAVVTAVALNNFQHLKSSVSMCLTLLLENGA